MTLHLVLDVPAAGNSQPEYRRHDAHRQYRLSDMKIGALCLLGYGFDNAWEIVPGVWTEQIWYQDRMLAERTFTVSKAE